MNSQKWSKSDALGSKYMFKDGLAEYYTVEKMYIKVI